MKRENVRKFYEDATGTLSATTRQLTLAGVAIIWLVRTGDTHGVLMFSPILRYSLVCYVLALGADLMQYTYQSAAWGIFNVIKEQQHVPADKEFAAPGYINWPAVFFFWSKVILAISGYAILLSTLGKQLLQG